MTLELYKHDQQGFWHGFISATEMINGVEKDLSYHFDG
jgi:hypothetical protein